MNSQYGSLGAAVGYLPCKPAAAAVTATGRNMILATKNFVEEKYDGEVIYGDSVAAYTPIVIRRPCGTVEVARVQDLCSIWRPDNDGKERSEEPMLNEVWTERGWTSILGVTRHLCSKPLFRITTTTGIVDVTQDHSLLTADGAPVQPEDVQVGQPLLSSCPSLPGLREYNVNEKSAGEVGGFCRDTGFLIPNFVLNAPHTVKRAFWTAYSKNGTVGPFAVVDMNQVALARIYILARCFGFRMAFHRDSTMTVSDKDVTAFHAGRGEVLSVQPLPAADGFVYDLTTANHHFQAGVGECIVHNTDSVFVKLPQHRHLPFSQLFDIGQEIAAGASALFPNPVQLEFEKSASLTRLP